MSSAPETKRFIKIFLAQLKQLGKELEMADAVLVGAGAGLSASAGLSYSGERFTRYFRDFHKKYGIADMYEGGFYPFATQEEYWAWWSRQILINRYDVPTGKLYLDLLELLRGRNYFVLTTNVDHQFQLAGFDKERLFYTRAIMACGNAQRLATPTPVIMKKRFVGWSCSSGTCGYPATFCPAARHAAAP